MRISIFEKIREAWDDYSVGVAILAIIGIIIGVLALWFVALCLQAWFIMLLWNWVMVALFNVPALNLWTAFGLCLLWSLLSNRTVTFCANSED